MAPERNSAARAPRRDAPRRKSFARDYAEAILIAVVVAFALRAFVVQAFRIPSGSMKLTLLVGDYVIVEKVSFRFRDPKIFYRNRLGNYTGYFSFKRG